MAYPKIIEVLTIFLLAKYSHTERRIRDGHELKSHKPYLAYFVQAPTANTSYNDWTCGGAIVSQHYVLTAAACLVDVHHLYVIVGYEKHISTEELETDNCAKHMKHKIAYICMPKVYEFEYGKVEKWSSVDIGLAWVSEPIKLGHSQYAKYCSYAPQKILINYDPKYQAENIDAIVMGWGHLEKWRQNSGLVCTEDQKEIYDDVRRKSSDSNATYNVSARRQGFCQNDHGGPLVTWVGGHEVVIGVASVFRVDAESHCEGPYLFTSTQCNGLFLSCQISISGRRSRICDLPPRERGYDLIERRIFWSDQSDRPHNEDVKLRPQIPISSFA